MATSDWPRAVLFDLDGTLIDSAPDIAASVNILLRRHGLGSLTLAQVTSMIGHGIEKTVERALAAVGHAQDREGLARLNAEMVDIYADNLTRLTIVMPGALETVETLHARGVRLGCATNKPQRAAEAVLAHYGFARYIDCVIGGDAGVAKKPAPDIVLAALERLGVEAWDAVMVGDSGADVHSAKAAGVMAILVRGGYSDVPVERLGADAIVTRLGELEGIVAMLRESG